MTNDKEEKTQTFKKIEKAMVYFDSEGKAAYLGLPKKIKEMRGGKAGITVKIFEGAGGEIGGEEYSEVDYHWVKITDEPVSFDDVSHSTKAVAISSGTVAVSASTAVTQPPYAYYEWIKCPKCRNDIIKGSKFCNHCGANLS